MLAKSLYKGEETPMSMAFVGYQLIGEEMISDDSDKYLMCQYLDEIDKICVERIGINKLSSLCEFDIDNEFGSSEEVLWVEPNIALELLSALQSWLKQQTSLEFLSEEQHNCLLEEIEESIDLAQLASENNAKFNLSLVS